MVDLDISKHKQGFLGFITNMSQEKHSHCCSTTLFLNLAKNEKAKGKGLLYHLTKGLKIHLKGTQKSGFKASKEGPPKPQLGEAATKRRSEATTRAGTRSSHGPS